MTIDRYPYLFLFVPIACWSFSRCSFCKLWVRIRRVLGSLIRLVWPARLPLKGPYPSYSATLAEASGYDSILIADTVERALSSVLAGDAAYERDGMAFPVRPRLHIFKSIKAVVQPGSCVADFGGGLGGLFINAPECFANCTRRIVIEQASMVKAGRRLARDHGLAIDFIESGQDPIPKLDVLILSSVLQYLPDPWQQLAQLLHSSSPAAVILDRTAVHHGPSCWYLQTNPGYYSEPVTYPVQILEFKRLLQAFRGYRVERRWHNRFDPGRPEHIGMLLLRDSPSAAPS